MKDASREIHSQIISPQSDYFQLLFDKERKRFDASDYDEIDEHQDPSIVMNRIYQQGFRDPDYYEKPLIFEQLEAPDEKTIKEEYMFKIPPWIFEIENPNAEVTHLLGGTSNEVSYVRVGILLKEFVK